jgi:hypothetical protein
MGTTTRHVSDTLPVLVFIDPDQAECLGQSIDRLMQVNLDDGFFQQGLDSGVHVRHR